VQWLRGTPAAGGEEDDGQTQRVRLVRALRAIRTPGAAYADADWRSVAGVEWVCSICCRVLAVNMRLLHVTASLLCTIT
jgi:hypothetical protein